MGGLASLPPSPTPQAAHFLSCLLQVVFTTGVAAWEGRPPRSHRYPRAESRGLLPPWILPHWGRKHGLLHGAGRLSLEV